MFIIDALLLLILLQVSLRFLHIFLQHLILFYVLPMIHHLFVKALDLTNLLKVWFFNSCGYVYYYVFYFHSHLL
jgi:hypothetical protein